MDNKRNLFKSFTEKWPGTSSVSLMTLKVVTFAKFLIRLNPPNDHFLQYLIDRISLFNFKHNFFKNKDSLFVTHTISDQILKKDLDGNLSVMVTCSF